MSPHVACHCFFPQLATILGEGDLTQILRGDDDKMYPSTRWLGVNTVKRRKLERQLALSLVLWLPLAVENEVYPLVMIESLRFFKLNI